MEIAELDRNFLVNTNIRKDKVKIFSAASEPLKLHGLLPPDQAVNKYKRLPEQVAYAVNRDVAWLYTHTAGGRLRFATDSDYIGVYAVLEKVGRMPHFALTGSAGFDLYREENGRQAYAVTIIPPFDIKDGGVLAGERSFAEKEMHGYTLNFPLYSEVKEVFIVLDENAAVQAPREYAVKKPIVYYGSSITQGGCASRPGNAYQSIISRRLDCDFINLGFSGSARGEDAIADYISGIDMSAFVLDYDHNAPSPEHLNATHERMYKRIREKNPDLPIICVSMPTPMSGLQYERRREIIASTVADARANGDENVYFINGCECADLLGGGDCISVDGCHPNDLGFFSLAKIIGDALEKAL